MGRSIFISYRRDDTEGEAGRLFDDLVRTYGDNSVFMDVAGINPGTDFRQAIEDNVATCGVLLAMIGPSWATITNSSGERRLEDPNDFVRLEIAAALARNIAVIPVLVHDAKMPAPDQLPENLKNLAYRNSVEITHARWNSDVQLLTKALGQYVAASSSTSTEPVHATVPVQLPPPNAPDRQPAPVKQSKIPLIAGIAVAAILLMAAGAYFVFHKPVVVTTTATTSVATQPASSGSAVAASAATGSESPVAGTWTNASPLERDGLQKLAITAAGNQLTLHAWGMCKPTDCDWGQQTATFDGQKATAVWSLMVEKKGEEKGRVATVTVAPANDALQVTVVNTYPHHPATQRQFNFTRTQ